MLKSGRKNEIPRFVRARGESMVAKVNSTGLTGIEGHLVICECDLSGGLPRLDIVGLPGASVRESQDRVRAAAKNCGFQFPARRITINLAPGELRKEGPIYDLPIWAGILAASGQLPLPPEDSCMLGELSLEGEVRAANGVLPMALCAREMGMKSIFVPADNACEAAIAEGLTVYPVHHARELAVHLLGQKSIEPQPPVAFENAVPQGLDFSDVMGQENVKRGLEIAAAGSHNVLLIGSPGSGKSMLSRRLPSILPDMTREEALEVTKVYSVAGLLEKGRPMVTQRPFRSPHHTVSAAGLAGGGRTPRPGEISLAHNGVLFLDELPEYHSDALEVLRQPLEDGCITVSRVSGSCTYPSRFMLVCAMNPCKCGYYGHPTRPCTCTEQSVRAYRKRLSGPLLDRIDLHIDVAPVAFESLRERTPAESSAAVRARVNAARARQTARYAGTEVTCNATLTPARMAQFCALDEAGKTLMQRAFDVMGLTARAYDRILKVARTIADLDGQENISAGHLAEAIQFRAFDTEKQ